MNKMLLEKVDLRFPIWIGRYQKNLMSLGQRREVPAGRSHRRQGQGSQRLYKRPGQHTWRLSSPA